MWEWRLAWAIVGHAVFFSEPVEEGAHSREALADGVVGQARLGDPSGERGPFEIGAARLRRLLRVVSARWSFLEIRSATRLATVEVSAGRISRTSAEREPHDRFEFADRLG